MPLKFDHVYKISPSHNYSLGWAEADVTLWIDYFIAGMADSFTKVRQRVGEGSAGRGCGLCQCVTRPRCQTAQGALALSPTE